MPAFHRLGQKSVAQNTILNYKSSEDISFIVFLFTVGDIDTLILMPTTDPHLKRKKLFF